MASMCIPTFWYSGMHAMGYRITSVTAPGHWVLQQTKNEYSGGPGQAWVTACAFLQNLKRTQAWHKTSGVSGSTSVSGKRGPRTESGWWE